MGNWFFKNEEPKTTYYVGEMFYDAKYYEDDLDKHDKLMNYINMTEINGYTPIQKALGFNVNFFTK
jgi:hypothetical protein